MTEPVYMVGKATCEICGGPATYSQFLALQDRTSLVCGSAYCKQVFSERKTLSPHVYRLRVERYRERVLGTKAREEEQRRYREKTEQEEALENQSILKRLMKNSAEHLSQPPYLISIPTSMSGQADLSESRIREYKSHLEAIIGKAFSEQLPDGTADEVKTETEELAAESRKFEKHSSLEIVTGHLCGTCKGGCCANGRNKAYLKVSTMVRVREILPEHSAEELLDEYISRLSGQTVEGSCINQTQSGCGLPRELRASNCNTYFCHGIRDLHVKFENESCLPPVLAIKRSNNNWNRFDPSFENEIIEAVLIDGDSVQQVEVK